MIAQTNPSRFFPQSSLCDIHPRAAAALSCHVMGCEGLEDCVAVVTAAHECNFTVV